MSTDPEFSRKASEIVGLYLNPPENAIVLSVDEKPSIQALERAQGYIRLPNGRAVSGFAHEYKRHGTTTLFAALETATGLVKAGHYKRRRRREFLDFMNGIIDTYGKEKEIFGSSQRLPPRGAPAPPLMKRKISRSHFQVKPSTTRTTRTGRKRKSGPLNKNAPCGILAR